VANKIDLGDRQVAREEGLAFAKSKAMVRTRTTAHAQYAIRLTSFVPWVQVFIECSAKTKLGIQQAFEELVTKVGYACPSVRSMMCHNHTPSA
jgi:hypothetical protein